MNEHRLVFTVLPLDLSDLRLEIDAANAASVLAAIDTLRCGDADVLFSGKYLFSVRRNLDGRMVIFERDPERDIVIVPFG